MIEEKGLQHEVIEVNSNGTFHLIEMKVLIELIEKAPKSEQRTILDTMSKIDFMNGDLMHFLTFLAEQYIKQLEKVLQYGI